MRKRELIKRAIKIAEKKYPKGYNKQQLIESSKEVFNGRKGIPTDYQEIKTEDDIVNQRNAMIYIDGHYPASITDCEVVGINGDCGVECPVFLRGDCKIEDPDAFLEEIRANGNIEIIKQLYPNIKEFQSLTTN